MNYCDENVEALAVRIPAPLLGRIPYMQQPSAAQAAEYLDCTSLPAWPAKRN
jgi:dethiobiotin synthetase